MIAESIAAAVSVTEKDSGAMSAEERLVAALQHVGEKLRQAKTDPVAVQVLGDQLIEHAQAIAETILE